MIFDVASGGGVRTDLPDPRGHERLMGKRGGG
jgi:hypothetical protein